MSDEPQVDLFGEPVPFEPEEKKIKHLANGYACRPGTGPDGQTCKTCSHACKVSGGRRSYWKCGLVRKNWTNSYGTDIRLKSPACWMWKEKP